VLARAHQSLIWARQRHVNALRSALREFYPGALIALGAQLAESEALAVLALAPTPEQGRQLTRVAVRRALIRAGRCRNLQARVVAIHDALAAPQLAAPDPVASAYREVVGALVTMLRCCNQQVAALEQQLTSQFGAHPDAAIVRSQPGLGVVLGARVLGEFGDAPDRYATAKGRKAFAGTAPVTRSSGLRTVVVARAACNQRLVDACYLWAFAALTASPGARRCYDAHRARGATHHQALRGDWEPAGRDPARLPGPPGHLPSAGRLAANRAGGLNKERGVPGGAAPRRYWPPGSPGERWCRWGRVAARSRRGAKEVGLLSGSRRRRLRSQLVAEERLDRGHRMTPA
jgi:Transposase IS116/IS110/IS902 family